MSQLMEASFRNEIIDKLDQIERQQADILAKQIVIENNQEDIFQQAREVNIILHGSEKLGVPPLHRQVKELYQFYDRAKWALGALGVTNIGFLITFLLSKVSITLP